MSAYICNPEQFALLAVTAYKRGLVAQAEDAAEMLARENIAGVAYDYPEDQDGDRPGPGLKDEDIVKAARIWVDYYLDNDPGASNAIIWNACDNLDYQSCEHDGWPASYAKVVLGLIRRHIGKKPLGDVAWGWSDPETLPEVEALYEGETA
jgi:hypothetical protein